MQLTTQREELFNVLTTIINNAGKGDTGDVTTAQDAMLLMRIDWEDLQACMRSKSVDGFEPVIDKMLHLAATTMSVAAALQSRVKNQYITHMENEAIVAVDKFVMETKKEKKKETAKPRKRTRR